MRGCGFDADLYNIADPRLLLWEHRRFEVVRFAVIVVGIPPRFAFNQHIYSRPDQFLVNFVGDSLLQLDDCPQSSSLFGLR